MLYSPGPHAPRNCHAVKTPSGRKNDSQRQFVKKPLLLKQIYTLCEQGKQRMVFADYRTCNLYKEAAVIKPTLLLWKTRCQQTIR